REVEAQVAGLVVRAALQRLGTENLPQGGVHDVRARVGLARADPPFHVDGGLDLLAGDQLTVQDTDTMDDQALDRALHVEDVELDALAPDPAGVAVLAAGLGVERGAIEHQFDDLAFAGRRDRHTIADDAAYPAVGTQLVVAGERCGTRLAQLPVGRRLARAGLLGPRVGLGAFTLFGHEPPELRLVDGQALLGGHLQREVDGEAVRVVQLERRLTRELG